MKTFDAFLPDLLPLVPGCPEPVAELALRRAAQRFCELTFAWRVKMDPIITVAGIDEYELSLDIGVELVRIESAQYTSDRERELKVLRPNEEVSRHLEYISTADQRTLIVNPVPTVERELVVFASLKPGNTAQGVEDFIYDQHVMVIAHGAAALLKQQPMKTYSSNDGLERWGEFERRCATIKLKAWRGFGRNTPRTKPNFF